MSQAASGLTAKQKHFCEALVACNNQSQAAREAGYSKSTANAIASRLMTNVNVQRYVAELRQKRGRASGVTGDKVLKELAKIGFANLPEESYKASDKIKALEKIGDYLGLFNDFNSALATISLYADIEPQADGSYVIRPTSHFVTAPIPAPEEEVSPQEESG